MPDNMRPVVLSVAAFKDIDTIDGGDMVVVRFNAPDGREVAILIPQSAIADLKFDLFRHRRSLFPNRGMDCSYRPQAALR